MPKISAFVVTYNRPQLLRACLRRARFVDELIVVDRSSTDETPAIARELADRYERVEWGPIADDVRTYAQSLCTGDWIICLDDDEVISVGAGDVLRRLIEREPAEVYCLPIYHFILARWDRALEHRAAFYARGAVTYSSLLHSVPAAKGREFFVNDGSVGIVHLSCPDVSSWVEKVNRYTSLACVQEPCRPLPRWSLAILARELLENRIGDRWFNDHHEEAVAVMRAVYDIVDELKRWEQLFLPNGSDTFAEFCRAIEEEQRAD